MDWTQWLPLIAVWIALLGMWGAMQHRLGRMDALESRMDKFQEEQREARAENIRLHEETRAEIRRDIRLILQVFREHTHADGSPATTPIPIPADSDQIR